MIHRHVTTRVILLLLATQVCQAQTPFVDGAFTTITADDDPDLVIVREKFDPEKNIQSIYIRFHDGTPDYEIVSGRVRFLGATPISLITSGRALKESDVKWGVGVDEGVNYGRNRGLDGPNITTHIPTDDLELAEAEHDLARLEMDEDGLSVRFWFGARRDVDDMRILLRYPDENQSASMQLVLYHRRGPDSEGYPGTSDGGLQIGAIDEDLTPDDGRYDNEVFSIEGLKLRMEDLDIVEEEIQLGRTDYRGGAIGPGVMTIDNMFENFDADNDNPRDQNGVISPVPTSGPLTKLRYRVSALEGPDGSLIPASGVQVLDLPRRLEEGQRSTGQLSVDAPPDLPEGIYSGTIEVWEDNNNDGLIDADEPQDSVTIVAEVRDDEEIPVDASQQMESADAGLSPIDMPDGAIDLGQSTLFEDARATPNQSSNDSGIEEDARIINPSKDQSVVNDVDGEVPEFGLSDADTLSGDAHVEQFDAESARVVQNDSSADDEERLLSGLPRGGAFQCNIAYPSPWAFLFLCVVFSALRRRR